MRRARGLAAGVIALGAAAALLSAGASAKRARAARDAADPAFEADIDLTDGPGSVAGSFKLRGMTLTALLPRAEDGAAAGVYVASLAAGDPLLAALAALPTKATQAAPRPDSAVVSVVVRAKAGAHNLISPRPSTDPAVARLLTELDRRAAAMRARPLLALRLEARPPASPAPAGRPATVIVRVTAEGAPGAEARIDPDTVLVQTASEPTRTPGVTPLPPEWQIASEPLPEGPPRALKPGAHLDLPFAVALATRGPGFVRAALDGVVGLHAPGAPDEGRMTLTSKPVAIRPR